MKINYRRLIKQPILLISILLASFGQLARFSMLGKPILAFEIVIGAQLLVWAIQSPKLMIYVISKLFFEFKYWWWWVIFSYLFNLNLLIGLDSISSWLAIWAKIGLFLLFGYYASRKVAASSRTQLLLVLSTLISWFGLLQFFLLPDTRFLKILGWDDHYFRLISTILDPNYAGIVIVGGLLILLLKLKSNWQQKKLLAMHTLALGLTFSRSAWLALILAMVFLGINKGRLKTLTHLIKPFSIIIFVLTLLAMLGFWKSPLIGNTIFRTNSINDRLQVSKSTFQDYQLSEWLIGRGLFVYYRDESSTFNQVNNFEVENTAHLANSWVETLVSGTGIVGLTVFLYYLRGWLTKHPLGDLPLATLIAFLTFGLFNNIVTSSFCLLWLMMIVIKNKVN